MKKILKKEIIISFIVGVILASSIAVYASISASEVEYKNGKSVASALNELYDRNKNINETDAVSSDIMNGKKAYTRNGLIIGTKTDPSEILSYSSADEDNFTSTYTATKECIVIATSIAEHDVGGKNAKSSTSQSTTGTLITEYTFTRSDAPAQIIQRIYKLLEGQTVSCVSSAYGYGFMKHLFIVY